MDMWPEKQRWPLLTPSEIASFLHKEDLIWQRAMRWHVLCSSLIVRKVVVMKRNEREQRFERAVVRETLDALNFMTYQWLKSGRHHSRHDHGKPKKQSPH
jgi:hypothetical protein